MDGSNGAAPTSVQAHLVRASKYNDGKTKNWSLFFFFRIKKQKEMEAAGAALQALVNINALPPEEAARARTNMERALENPAFARAIGGEEFREAARGLDLTRLSAKAGKHFERDSLIPEPAADAFYAWLSVITEAKKEAFLTCVENLVFGKREDRPASTIQNFAAAALKTNVSATDIKDLAIASLEFLQTPSKFRAGLRSFGTEAEPAGLKALQGGLASTVLYELLRQAAPAFAEEPPAKSRKAKVQAPQPVYPVVRSESDVGARDEKVLYDRVPINITFTHAGLTTLELDETTLASFPDDFKQGMATRAKRLGDTGDNAPEQWEGELGQKAVHGFFTGGFAVDDACGVDEKYWRRLRAEVRAFNDPVSVEGRNLRKSIGALALSLGLEIVHIELGQDPYELEHDETAHRLPYRVEHFGFRDGISQPFADMNLGDPGPGNGTPARNRTWAPVAPGEIYLDCVDEDGGRHLLPANAELRSNGTYLVFRKLEQDVIGLRTFLAKQRPENRAAQEALAAQFVGRWKNGTPLVLSPDAPRSFETPKDAAPDDPRIREEQAALNEFLYASDDPRGRKCPLSAHIRRTNPRDIGGRNDVRRHRILRRGISYGGSLLRENSLGDGEKRGMLFIAANARVDMQFETIQSEWINGGEFMGQAGLGRCPLTGAHAGRSSDTFLEAGAVAPINGLPAFVRTLGGDYFFAPGVETLKKIAVKETFKAPKSEVPFEGYSLNDPITPVLFDTQRILKYAVLMLFDVYDIVRVELPLPPKPDEPEPGEPKVDAPPESMVFVAKFADVQCVLKGKGSSDFSVAHYRAAMEQMTRGGNFLVGTDLEGPTSGQRERMRGSLDDAWTHLIEAWGALGDPKALEKRVRDIARKSLDAALRRCASTRNVDLVHDFAAEATYAILDQLFGVPGPNWVTELAIALPFARTNVSGIHEEWLAALKKEKPDRPRFLTMQVWSLLVLADLIGNVYNMQELKEFSRKAASETLTHIDSLIARARANPPKAPRTLLNAFVKKEPNDPAWDENTRRQKLAEYYQDVALLLAELAGTALTVVPLTFASVMSTVFAMRMDLSRLVEILAPPGAPGGDGLRRLIYEGERFTPNMPIRMRRCEVETKLPSGAVLNPGEWVACIVQAATFHRFEDPFQFSLDPYIKGPARDLNDYFLFGAYGSRRECWGRDKIAIIVLEECLKAAGRLRGLRRIAGPSGEIRRVLSVPVGLQARFVDIA